MSIRAIDAMRERIAQIKAAPALVARSSAALIQAKLRKDATTKRGNVPTYGRMGNVPITASARPEAIVVRGPDFVIEKARELGQVDEWVGIVQRESQRIFAGKP